MNQDNTFVFFTEVPVNTPEEIKHKLMKSVNKAHVGDAKVNLLDEETGRITPNPEVTITDEHKEATWHVNACHRVKLKVTVDCSTGYFSYEVA